MATTGKTTLIAWALTPRALVLALLTGVGVAAPAPEGARASHTISPTTTPNTISTVRICMAGGRRRRRRQLRPIGRNGLRGRIRPDRADVLMAPRPPSPRPRYREVD